MGMDKLFLIANIKGEVFSINPEHIETIGTREEHGGIVTNDIMMSSGEVHTVPVQMIIVMLNTAEYTVYDLIAGHKVAAEMTEDGDVNDTEYCDETPLEEPDLVNLEPYPPEFNDGHPEFEGYLSEDEDVGTDFTVEPIIEGSKASGG